MPLRSHLTITNPWKYLFLHKFCVPLTQAHAEVCKTKLFPLVNFIGCPELTSGQTMVPRQVWKPCWEMEWLFFRSGGGQAGSGAQRDFLAFRVRGGTTPALWAPCPSHPAHVISQHLSLPAFSQHPPPEAREASEGKSGYITAEDRRESNTNRITNKPKHSLETWPAKYVQLFSQLGLLEWCREGKHHPPASVPRKQRPEPETKPGLKTSSKTEGKNLVVKGVHGLSRWSSG